MLTRRDFELAFLAIAGFGPALPASAEDQDSVSVRVRADDAVVGKTIPMIVRRNLSVEPDHSEAAKALASRLPPGKAIPAILIVAGVMAVPMLVEMIDELLRQKDYGGVIIDFRQSPPLISHDLSIPANMVFVIDPAGKVQKHDGSIISADWLRTPFRK
jgi:hypothetical protein